MPLFDVFKKKKIVQAPKQEVKKEIVQKDPSGIILKPYASEKAGFHQQNNEYVFEVYSLATKLMIRNAVSRMYGVNAQKVRIINVKPRKVRVGKFQGKKPGFKKAIVKLKIGQKIDSLPA